MSKTYRVTVPVETPSGRTYFNPIGIAFLQKEGSKSFMKVKLSALPVNGELVIFEPKDNEDGTDGQVTE